MQKDAYLSEGRKVFQFIRFFGLIFLPVMLFIVPFEWVSGQHSICIYKNITGHECYGCGMTRAILSAIHFKIAEAFYYNKLVVIVLPLLTYIWAKNILFLLPGKLSVNSEQ